MRAIRRDGAGLSRSLINLIVIKQPQNRRRNRRLLSRAGLPMVETANLTETNRLYAAWSLTRR
jgi:hypothetical protein